MSTNLTDLNKIDPTDADLDLQKSKMQITNFKKGLHIAQMKADIKLLEVGLQIKLREGSHIKEDDLEIRLLKVQIQHLKDQVDQFKELYKIKEIKLEVLIDIVD